MKNILFLLIFICIRLGVSAQYNEQKHSYEPEIVEPEQMEKLPEYPGGAKAWFAFLHKNLKWPNQAKVYPPRRVIISFDIEKNGSLNNIQVLKGLNNKFNAELIRVMKISPKWIPGLQNGKPVKVRYALPIIIDLAE